MAKYVRTTPVSYYDLTETQKENLKDVYSFEPDDLYEGQYVDDPCDPDSVLPLSMFLRLDNSKLWDGYYGQSYFSAYFIKFDRRNSECVVAYRTC